MDNHDCKQETAINMISQDVREIRRDVKKLLAFKWQIVGGAIATSAIVSFLFNYLLKKGG